MVKTSKEICKYCIKLYGSRCAIVKVQEGIWQTVPKDVRNLCPAQGFFRMDEDEKHPEIIWEHDIPHDCKYHLEHTLLVREFDDEP